MRNDNMSGLDQLIGVRWEPSLEVRIRSITNRAYVQVLDEGSMMTADFRNDRVRVIVDQTDRIVEFLIG